MGGDERGRRRWRWRESERGVGGAREVREERKESVIKETMKETEGLRGMTREGRKIEEREEAEMIRMNKQGRGREAER